MSLDFTSTIRPRSIHPRPRADDPSAIIGGRAGGGVNSVGNKQIAQAAQAAMTPEQRDAARRAIQDPVYMHTFTEDWDVWEMHPKGAEVVLCTAGSMELLQELDGEEVVTAVSAGEYAINQPGTWHTANVSNSATALFITAGEGTTHRPR